MSRARRKGGLKGTGPANRAPLGTDERDELRRMFQTVLQGARSELTGDDPLEVELWASRLWDVASGYQLTDGAEEIVGAELIRYASWQQTAEAVHVLRALGAVAPAPHGEAAVVAADRLARRGLPEPPWTTRIGKVAPTDAFLLEDTDDDDGVDVMVSFDGPGARHTVVVYVDHNLGGIAKDAFCVPGPVSQVLTLIADHAESPAQQPRPISLGEAAARWRDALERTEMTLDPPVSEELGALRAVVRERLAMLPDGGDVPAPADVTEDEREGLIEEFLGSPEVAAVDRHEAAAIVPHILHFALDYVLGVRLRFSPVMVEIFCCDWAPRHVVADGDQLELLPDVLGAWIAFAGRRRGISQRAIDDAVAAVDHYRGDLLVAAADEGNWGPAKSLAMMMMDEGIDLTDADAVKEFIDSVR